MSLNIKNPATVALVYELARRQGISKTAAIHQALTERLHRLGHADVPKDRMLYELRAIRKRSTASRVGKAQRRGHRRVR